MISGAEGWEKGGQGGEIYYIDIIGRLRLRFREGSQKNTEHSNNGLVWTGAQEILRSLLLLQSTAVGTGILEQSTALGDLNNPEFTLIKCSFLRSRFALGEPNSKL